MEMIDYVYFLGCIGAISKSGVLISLIHTIGGIFFSGLAGAKDKDKLFMTYAGISILATFGWFFIWMLSWFLSWLVA